MRNYNWSHRMVSIAIILGMGSALSLMAGCGQKGALYLPEPSTQQTVNKESNSNVDSSEDMDTQSVAVDEDLNDY
ncbi:LPS translocon maturation chaperone LptM [Psychrobacter sp. I-STPA6b]|uniref:LPS translocon maturation chaperone LptM n=1 Tax=Psychrobacter sp. I-STPA6b TaxID=2585718 RepID=UPI001D0C9370|nr:lipoprotein [Psychrobacter sp. I-STPA6b]